MVKKKIIITDEPPTVLATLSARLAWELDRLLDRLGLVRKTRVKPPEAA